MTFFYSDETSDADVSRDLPAGGQDDNNSVAGDAAGTVNAIFDKVE